MKRVILAGIMLLSPCLAWGAGTIAYVANSDVAMTIECTAHTDGTFEADLSDAMMSDLHGFYVYEIVSYSGATTVTADSDLAITDSLGRTVMSATGNGLNFVDDNTVQTAYTEGPNGDHYYLVDKNIPLTFTISNNDVASAKHRFRISKVK
ncbi:MAG: hypothetical protein WC372_10500 [Candidatus Neomarinimicrobiota bacterium]|jgi:hypothetical protein